MTLHDDHRPTRHPHAELRRARDGADSAGEDGEWIRMVTWRWRRRSLLAGVETAMVVGYVTIAAMSLLGLRTDPQIAYWLTAAVTASFAAEMLVPTPENL